MWCRERLRYILNGPVEVVRVHSGGMRLSQKSSGLLGSCFVIHYTDVSKYRVDWNYQDEANGLHF